jgi:hypothetical protein
VPLERLNHDSANYRERRGLGLVFALCALSMLALLTTHPNGGAPDLAGVLRYEALHQSADALVHGGFIVVLGVLIVCFVLLAQRLGSARVIVVIGLVSFCIGCGAMMASMILDGFVTPAIGARFADTGGADNLLMARTLLIFIGTLIRFLMPMGMLFQTAAILSWSAAIVMGRGLQRAIGVFGLIAALTVAFALLAVPASMTPHVLLGGIALQALWYFALAALLSGRGVLT